MKKLFSVLIIISLIFTAIPVNAQTDLSDYTIYTGFIPAECTMADSEYYGKSLTDFQKGFYRAFVDKFTEISNETLLLKQAVEVEYTVTSSDVITSQEELDAFVNQELSQFQTDLSTQTLYNAIQYDHTEIFWMREAGFKIGVSASVDENGGATLVFTVTMLVDSSKLFNDESAMRTAASDVEMTVRNILEDAPTDTYEAVGYFNEWLSDNNTYNHSHIDNDNYPLAHTAYSALTSNNVEEVGPVCQGYAYAFKYLCDRAGIECVVISGTLYQSLADLGPHAWNAVKIDGNWYGVDVTSNDSLSSNEYNFLAGSTTPSHDAAYTTFSATHVNDTMLSYPTLSETAYEKQEIVYVGEISTSGANIRLGENAGLRFRTVVDKNELFDKYYPTQDAEKTYTYGEDANLMFGTLMIPKDLITSGSTVQAMFEAGSSLVLDVPAKKIYDQDSETVTFTGVLTNIPKNTTAFNRDIASVSYMKYRESAEDEWTYVFSDQSAKSYYTVAKAARSSDYSDANNPKPSDEVKAVINQLDEIIELAEEDKGWIEGWY